MEALKYSKQQLIPLYLCDRHRELPLNMLTRMMLDVSGSQTNELEGDKVNSYLKENDLSWIILQGEFNITRMPKVGETIEIETYALAYNRLFCYRHFNVYGEDGTKIGEAVVTFAWLDLNRRKMARLDSEIIDLYGAPFEKSIRRLPNPKKPNETSASVTEFDIYYSDIDINNHVNNTIYMEWAMNSLEIDFVNNHQLTYMNIKFDKEVLEDQQVKVYSDISREESKVVTAHNISTEGQTNAQIELRWTER